VVGDERRGRQQREVGDGAGEVPPVEPALDTAALEGVAGGEDDGSVMTSSEMGHRKSSGHASILGGRIRGAGACRGKGGTQWNGKRVGVGRRTKKRSVDGNRSPWERECGHRPVSVSVLFHSHESHAYLC
jgi:hypothetical protein